MLVQNIVKKNIWVIVYRNKNLVRIYFLKICIVKLKSNTQYFYSYHNLSG